MVDGCFRRLGFRIPNILGNRCSQRQRRIGQHLYTIRSIFPSITIGNGFRADGIPAPMGSIGIVCHACGLRRACGIARGAVGQFVRQLDRDALALADVHELPVHPVSARDRFCGPAPPDLERRAVRMRNEVLTVVLVDL